MSNTSNTDIDKKILTGEGLRTLVNYINKLNSTTNENINALVLNYNKVENTDLSTIDHRIELYSNKKLITSVSVNDFIKDAMLNNITIDIASENNAIEYNNETYSSGEKFLKFEFNDDAKELGISAKYIKIDDIANPYAGSDSIAIDDKRQISVKEVKTDKTKTTEEIIVAGTPIADFLNTYSDITKFDANTDIQQILTAILCSVIWPTPVFNEGSITASIAKPSLSFSSSNTTVEVGEKITVNKCTISEISTSYTNRGWTNLDYGYKETLNGEKKSDKYLYAKNSGVNITPGENYKLQMEYSGFYNNPENDTSENSSYTNVSIDSKTLTVGETICKVKATVTGPSAYITYDEIPSIYYYSNTNKTDDQHFIEEKSNDAKTTENPTNYKEITITGKRYAYTGVINSEVQFNPTSDSIRSLTKRTYSSSSLTSITGDAGSNTVIIAFPSDWGTLKKVIDVGNMSADITTAFTLTNDVAVEGANDFSAANYKVYVYTSDVTLGAINYTLSIS